MARFLLLTPGFRGHFNPNVGVALRLRELGHDVAWACMNLSEIGDQLDRLGITKIPIPQPMPQSDEQRARISADPGTRHGRIRQDLIDIVPRCVDGVRASLREHAADCLLLDPVVYSFVIAAELEAMPYLGLHSSLTLLCPPGLEGELWAIRDWLAPAREELFAGYGLQVDAGIFDVISPHANSVLTTELFAGDCPRPAGVDLVGPSIPPRARGDEPAFPWEALAPDRPIVYVSFGTIYFHQVELMRRTFRAARRAGAQVVACIGPLDRAAFGDDAEGVLLAPYVPQLAVLERADLFVTHGGANSVMESLHHGVPMLVLPIATDQPLQAHLVERAGVGRRLWPAEATEDALSEALSALLARPEYRSAAERMRASYRSHDGARAQAELAIRLARA